MANAETYNVREVDAGHDVRALVRLLNAVEEDAGDPDLSTGEGVRARLHQPRTRRYVAEAPSDPETLEGYGLIHQQTSARSAMYVAVHPARRRCGVGSAVLAHLLEQARAAGATHANAEVDEHDAAGRAFLQRHGFVPAGHVWMLEAPADLVPATPEWPGGYTVRSYAEVLDPAVLVDVCNRSRRDMWGHAENTPGAVTEERVAQWLPGWNLEGVFLAFGPDGDAAGICQAMPAEAAGAVPHEIDGPTVVPEHRPLRLRRPLVLAALGWLRGHGARPVRLMAWGDDEATAALYGELGFRTVRHEIAYCHNLA